MAKKVDLEFEVLALHGKIDKLQKELLNTNLLLEKISDTLATFVEISMLVAAENTDVDDIV